MPRGGAKKKRGGGQDTTTTSSSAAVPENQSHHQTTAQKEEQQQQQRWAIRRPRRYSAPACDLCHIVTSQRFLNSLGMLYNEDDNEEEEEEEDRVLIDDEETEDYRRRKSSPHSSPTKSISPSTVSPSRNNRTASSTFLPLITFNPNYLQSYLKIGQPSDPRQPRPAVLSLFGGVAGFSEVDGDGDNIVPALEERIRREKQAEEIKVKGEGEDVTNHKEEEGYYVGIPPRSYWGDWSNFPFVDRSSSVVAEGVNDEQEQQLQDEQQPEETDDNTDNTANQPKQDQSQEAEAEEEEEDQTTRNFIRQPLPPVPKMPPSPFGVKKTTQGHGDNSTTASNGSGNNTFSSTSLTVGSPQPGRWKLLERISSAANSGGANGSNKATTTTSPTGKKTEEADNDLEKSSTDTSPGSGGRSPTSSSAAAPPPPSSELLSHYLKRLEDMQALLDRERETFRRKFNAQEEAKVEVEKTLENVKQAKISREAEYAVLEGRLLDAQNENQIAKRQIDQLNRQNQRTIQLVTEKEKELEMERHEKAIILRDQKNSESVARKQFQQCSAQTERAQRAEQELAYLRTGSCRSASSAHSSSLGADSTFKNVKVGKTLVDYEYEVTELREKLDTETTRLKLELAQGVAIKIAEKVKPLKKERDELLERNDELNKEINSCRMRLVQLEEQLKTYSTSVTSQVLTNVPSPRLLHGKRKKAKSSDPDDDDDEDQQQQQASEAIPTAASVVEPSTTATAATQKQRRRDRDQGHIPTSDDEEENEEKMRRKQQLEKHRIGQDCRIVELEESLHLARQEVDRLKQDNARLTLASTSATHNAMSTWLDTTREQAALTMNLIITGRQSDEESRRAAIIRDEGLIRQQLLCFARVEEQLLNSALPSDDDVAMSAAKRLAADLVMGSRRQNEMAKEEETTASAAASSNEKSRSSSPKGSGGGNSNIKSPTTTTTSSGASRGGSKR